MEYINKELSQNINPQKLCDEKLVFFKKGYVGALFLYRAKIAGRGKNLLVKKTHVSKTICNEAVILKKINLLMDKKKIPDLYSKVYLIYKCKGSNFYLYRHLQDVHRTPEGRKLVDNYIFIMDKYGDQIYKELDSKDIKKVKSVTVLLLVAIWHMTHNIDIYHDDICTGHRGTLLNNVILEKTSANKIKYSLKNKKINVDINGYSIRIIDFGRAHFKDIYIHKKIHMESTEKNRNMSLNRFYAEDYHFKNFKFKSEIIYVLKCLFSYWRLSNNITKILFEYYHEMSKNYKRFDLFDENVVMDINKNFLKIIRLFSDKWPNPPYITWEWRKLEIEYDA